MLSGVHAHMVHSDEVKFVTISETMLPGVHAHMVHSDEVMFVTISETMPPDNARCQET